MNILFIGDIVGRIGRQATAKVLPKIKKKYAPDLVIANAENAAHGSGITEATVKELLAAGIDAMTLGDHAFGHKTDPDLFEKYPIIRPANYAPAIPGRGHLIVPVKGKNILIINLIGRVFMKMQYENPFLAFDEILANLDLPPKSIFAIITDIHAEATAEKVAFSKYADGRASAVVGTHTHIPTADARISDKGTAAITDVGMVGAADASLGVEFDGIIKTFLTQIKHPHVIPEKGSAIFNAVLIKLGRNGKAMSIKPIRESVMID